MRPGQTFSPRLDDRPWQSCRIIAIKACEETWTSYDDNFIVTLTPSWQSAHTDYHSLEKCAQITSQLQTRITISIKIGRLNRLFQLPYIMLIYRGRSCWYGCSLLRKEGGRNDSLQVLLLWSAFCKELNRAEWRCNLKANGCLTPQLVIVTHILHAWFTAALQ